MAPVEADLGAQSECLIYQGTGNWPNPYGTQQFTREGVTSCNSVNAYNRRGITCCQVKKTWDQSPAERAGNKHFLRGPCWLGYYYWFQG